MEQGNFFGRCRGLFGWFCRAHPFIECTTNLVYFIQRCNRIACIYRMQFKGLGFPNKCFCNAKIVFVYTKTLLATTMKPLNALSKFENHFVIRTVCFQVQLEADGYFFSRKFLSLQPQQAGQVGTNLQFWNQIFQIRLQKHLLGFAQTRYSAQNCADCASSLTPNKQIFLEKRMF